MDTTGGGTPTGATADSAPPGATDGGMPGGETGLRHLTGVAPLAEEYDGFVLDLWGVIHDGVEAYPGAADCLAWLRARGKRTVLLSNAPRRNEAVRKMMRRMGIADDLYTDILTSGEASYLLLRDRPDEWSRALGRRAFHIGPERDRNVFAGLDVDQVELPEQASFVLNTGPDDHANPTDPAAFDGVLDRCAAAGLPMLCANPDLEVIRGGVRVVCAGALALRYQERGGDVRLLGKPDPAIYVPVLRLLDLPKARVMAVGDSLRTDIAGATAAGLDSCWVLGGLHLEELGSDPDRIAAAARAAGLGPAAVLPRFVW